MSQEITLYDKIQDPVDAAIKFGEYIGKSMLFGTTKVEQGAVLAMACFFERRSPLEIKRRYHIMSDGNISQKALSQFADFRAKGGKVKWLDDGSKPKDKDEDWKAVAEVTFEGQTMKVEFSIADAKRQGLSFKPGSGWVKTPGNMLRARVITNALGMLCPEIVAGSEDDGDQEQPEPKQLLPKQPKETGKETKVTVSAPIDVQATVSKADDSHPDLKPSTQAATPAPAPAAPAAPAEVKPFKAEADANGKLTTATVQALQAAIGEDNAQVADAWFLKNKWIATSGDYFNIPIKKVQMFLDNPTKALATMKAQVGAK